MIFSAPTEQDRTQATSREGPVEARNSMSSIAITSGRYRCLFSPPLPRTNPAQPYLSLTYVLLDGTLSVGSAASPACRRPSYLCLPSWMHQSSSILCALVFDALSSVERRHQQRRRRQGCAQSRNDTHNQPSSH